MDGYSASGMMAVCAVSGSVVLVALQAHKRLLSQFMEKMELELYGCERNGMKKKVRFAKEVREASGNNKEYRKRQMENIIAKQQQQQMREEEEERVVMNKKSCSNNNINGGCEEEEEEDEDEDGDPMMYDRYRLMSMPKNRLVLYKGLLDYKVLVKGRNVM